MKRLLLFVVAVLAAYLIVTFAIGAYAEYRFRAQLASTLQLMSLPAFKVTKALETEMRGNKKLHRFAGTLNATPPIGWIVLGRMGYIEDGVVYASQNAALPAEKRFQDAAKARSYGFDPEKKSDDDVVAETVALVW